MQRFGLWTHGVLGVFLCVSNGTADAEAVPNEDASAYDEDLVYETEVRARRIRPTDETTGFAETIVFDRSADDLSDLADTLSSAVGVSVPRLGGLGAFGAASIRGSTPGQVPVFLDGIPLNVGGFSVVNLADFSPSTLESVAVYRGSTPLSLGGGGIGGALVLTTRSADAATNEFAAGFGTLNTWRLLTLYSARLKETKALAVVTGQHSDGDFLYYNRGGSHNGNTDDDAFTRRLNNDHTAYSALLKLERRIADTTVVALDEVFFKTQGVAGLDHMDRDNDAALDTFRNTLSLRLDKSVNDLGALTADLGYLLMSEGFRDLSGAVGIGHRENRYRTHGLFADLLYRAAFSKRHISSARVATRFEHYDETRIGLPASEQQAPSTRTRIEIGAEHEWRPSPPLHIVPILRGELHHAHFGGGPLPSIQGDFPETVTTTPYFTPSLGLRFGIVEGLELRANGGRYIRTPDLTELFGDRGAVVGNPDLEAEVGYNGDLGLTYVTGRHSALDTLRLDAAYFTRRAEKLIALEPNSQSTVRPVNVDAAVVHGVELAARLALFDTVTLSGNYTYFHGINRSNIPYYAGKRLPRRPAHEAYGRVDIERRIADIALSCWFDADFAGKAYAGQYNAERNVTMHWFMGAGARFGLPELGLTVTLEVQNLADTLVFKNNEGVWLPMSDADRYPLPGRTFFATVHWKRPTGP